MTERDEKLSRRYRELPRDEPPNSIDAAIRAQAHRAVRRAHPRWMGAVSIAAVLVLALGITLRMQHDEPGMETAPTPAAAPPRIDPAPATAPPRIEPAAPASREIVPRAAPTPRPASVPPPDAQRSREDSRAERSNLATPARVAAPAMQKRAADAMSAPEAQLEQIAALREAGRAAEADEALARFRERFPDYRIPDALWQRVRPR